MPLPASLPSIPTPEPGRTYRLTAWTPEKAELLIKKLKEDAEANPWPPSALVNTLPSQYQGLAELENSLHFPQADQAQSWQWNGAYNLYLSGNTDIGALYAALIADALNEKETNPQDLETWLKNILPFELVVFPTTPPRGYQLSLILHLISPPGNRFTGGFTVWLVEKEGKYFGYPLKNANEIPFRNGESHVDAVDITKDGIAEAIVQNSDWQSFGGHDGELKIYRLDQVPPQEIALDPIFENTDIATWSVDQNQALPIVTFQTPVSTATDLPCYPIKIDWQYQWQAEKLRLVRMLPPTPEELKDSPVCARLFAAYLSAPQYLENREVLEEYKLLLELPFINEEPGSFDPGFNVEEARFSLALFLSSQGNEAEANEQLQIIRASTDPTLAEWRQAALAFYAVRRDPRALLNFCLNSQKCATFLDFTEIVALISPDRFLEVETILNQMGLQFHETGSYDFDQDGQLEKWLWLSDRHCSSFSILSKGENTIENRWVTTLCDSEEQNEEKKLSITPQTATGKWPLYQVTLGGQESLPRTFMYWPLDQEEFIVNPLEFEQKLNQVQNQLLTRQISPDEAQAQLNNLLTLPIGGSDFSDWDVHIYYLLGLTRELNGESAQAAQTYFELWQTFPNSSYTMMAFSKLELVRP